LPLILVRVEIKSPGNLGALVVWIELKPVSKQEMAGLRGLRRAKLYAEENIEDEVIEVFRSHTLLVNEGQRWYQERVGSFTWPAL
jgi:hypothetical protein